jgi:hypothetical protein
MYPPEFLENTFIIPDKIMGHKADPIMVTHVAYKVSSIFEYLYFAFVLADNTMYTSRPETISFNVKEHNVIGIRESIRIHPLDYPRLA